MREDLLHFIWKYKKLQLADLITSDNETVTIIDVGLHNHQSGPDFFNSKIKIGNQLWAGNVEMHLKSSDWYVHNHQQDSNYNNVILHVVWQDDSEIFRSDGTKIPTVALKNYISQDLLNNYQNLLNQSGKSFINCENEIASVDDFLLNNWKERLFFERLEAKSDLVYVLLKESNNDWEQVLFKMLLKNFGLKINGQAFMSLANALDFSILKKLRNDTFALESVFFGMSSLLEKNTIVDDYYIQLKKEYQFQKKKFELQEAAVQKPEFFKLRPSNFPTIRLSQLASLYSKHQNLFSVLINCNDLSEMYRLFNIKASEYWTNHYTFGKLSKKNPKRLTKKFIDLLIVNTILPIKFSHAKYLGKVVDEEIQQLISHLKSEENTIVSNYKMLKVNIKNAGDSQAIIQLYNEYCSKNRCLQCAVGAELLKGNS
ncbi:DUF2851 family protein [Aurantibacter crassamenti]|uniref:DUF2851 family protein n=1 Tax=Aurantibacter crassamenti TaxID=1837375 RepID=UPI00193A01DF|nr:DUF2851 family protein [Aurantibacter crassamenti]MBM1107986.1 DUF2851 family protein [Aurantibacter crassamenti]